MCAVAPGAQAAQAAQAAVAGTLVAGLECFPPSISASALRWLVSLAEQAGFVDASVLRPGHREATTHAATHAHALAAHAPHAAHAAAATTRFSASTAGGHRGLPLGWHWLQRLVSLQLLRCAMQAAAPHAPFCAPPLRERPGAWRGGAAEDTRLLLAVARHGVGQLVLLQADTELLLPPELWRGGAVPLVARQAALLHALLAAPWADAELHRLGSLPAPACPCRPGCVEPAAADVASSCAALGLPPPAESNSLHVRLRPPPGTPTGENVLIDLWVHREGLTLRSLTERVRQKLAQPTGFCLALLKMPDVMLADEEDVRHLEGGAELVLLAKQAPPPLPPTAPPPAR